VGEGGRNDPNIVCKYELKKKENRTMKPTEIVLSRGKGG
jgi:hypothetical protein